MSNYVSNKVICTKPFFDKYFLDPYSLGEKSYDYCKEHKYISFNKLFGLKDISDYMENYGRTIDYGYWYCIKEIDKEHIELMFQTRWDYPIYAIKKAIELDHSIIWYAVEENIIYISKFMWDNNKVIEKVLDLGTNDFGDWYDKNIYNGNTYDEIDDADDAIWYYDYNKRKDWIVWECDDLIKRYIDDYPARDYYDWRERQGK